jgi:eukaryotic-like serine/threonine-protein kinase
VDKERKERRDRLVALSFVVILLLLVYGPGARWFAAADRILYDQIAASLDNAPLANAVIVSIDPEKVPPEELPAVYGSLLRVLKSQDAERIVMPQPPAIEPGAELPGWAATLSSGVPVFVPRGHRLDRVATWSGFLKLQPDDDGILRRSSLWQFESGVMFPSLALAIALQNPRFASDADAPIPGADAAVYLSSYAELPRLSWQQVLGAGFPPAYLAGRTVFLDAEPPLVAAAATLPSGQYVTRSEVTAALLAGIEQDQAITAPIWIVALQWLAPVLLAAGAVLLLPGRSRRDVLVLAVAVILALVFVEVLLLAVGRVRLDLGRPAFIFTAAAILCWWFATSGKKAAVNAFKRGTDFLAAGRLEPAFAEFRRCEPTESLATVMYKLSLAFEEQAKPERAEAVIQWMKRSQNPSREKKFSLSDNNGGVPHRLGRYVIEKRIGRGAMGAVYLARDPRINRPVALKVIPIEKEFEDEELEEARLRFFREAESAGRLTHPNIITVYDCGEDKHLAYIAMEYLPGLQLTHFTDPTKLLAPKKALELCARTADALDYAHNQQVIHRDIKPANLLYDNRADVLKISDFGVARLTDNNRTKTGIVLGTPMYMSPEQLGAEDLTGLSDLFSLGVTLYELLAGEVPFKATNIAVLMSKITSEEPVPVSNRRAGIPPGVDAVLSKALAKRPDNRFANGGEMAIALRNCARYASA